MKRTDVIETEPPFTTLAVANMFIEQGRAEHIIITNLKLQKLLYFAHCDLVLTHGKAWLDEEPQAWGRGPVFAGIYHRFKCFGKSAIKAPLDLGFSVYPVIKNEDINDVVHILLLKYRKYEGDQLSDMTHKADGAWNKCYNPDEPHLNRTITIEDILQYEKQY